MHALVALYLVSVSITSQPQPQSVQLLQVSMFLHWNFLFDFTDCCIDEFLYFSCEYHTAGSMQGKLNI